MNSCYSCTYRLSFTHREREILLPKLRAQGLLGYITAACTAPWQIQPTLIRRYLDREIAGCTFYQKGYYREYLHISCPTCKDGRLMINRPVNGYRPYLLIGCSNYPMCRFTIRHVGLKTNCRYCKTPLFLKSGAILTCYCPQCKRSIEIPLLACSWPALLHDWKLCPHKLPWDECAMCQRSLIERTSLIDLELPDIANLWLQGIGNNGELPLSPTHGHLISIDAVDDIVDGIDEDYILLTEDDDWNYEDMVNDYLEFTDEYMECMGYELKMDWFYGE